MLNIRKDVLKFINGVPKELEIVNTGSTFAKFGFDYKYFGKKGFNFALAPQPLSYDYKILNKYKDCIKPAAVVVVVVCPFGFSLADYDNDDTNYKYYFFLGKNDINNYSKKKEILIKHCPVLLKPKLMVYFVKAATKKIINYTKKKSDNSINNIVLTAKERINGWKMEFGLKNVTNYKPNEKLKKAFEKTTENLRKIIDFCIENKFRPIIINMPACKEESQEFSNEFIETFYSENVKKANIHNVPVIDYFRDKRFHDYSLYMNADCFNDKGREFFAKIFISDLQKLGLWED